MTSIINADDGSISGRPGLRTISGTSANLQIQVNGTTVMNVSSNHSVTFNSTVHMPSIVSPTLETMSSSSGSAFAQANLAYTAANTAVTTGQANVGAGLITTTAAYQANVGAGLITTTAAYQANVGAGLITTTAAYQANVGSARIEVLGRADSAFGQANLAYTAANTAVTSGQANVGAGLITTTAAYQANVGAARIEILGRADSAFGQANLAYSAANTKLASAGGTITGNLQIDGNLTISGATTTVSANNLIVKDNMIFLNDEDFSSNVDLGFAGNYNDGTYRHTGLFRDASDGIWKFYDNYLPEPDAAVNIDTSNTSFRIATVFANVKTDVISVRGMDPLGVANSAFGQANLAYTAANTAVTTGQANVGAGLITTTAAYQANVGAGLITAKSTWEANTGAGLLTRLPLAGGTLTGSRTIQFDTSGGSIFIKGDSGGWGTGLYFKGSDDVVKGSFGALGGGSSFTYLWAGIDYNNNWMRFSSSEVNSLVALQQGGNQVLHAGNYTSYALPLTGGSLSGVLTINSTNDNQLLLQSSDSWTGIGFNDSAVLGTDFIWHNGTNGTFAIGGGGANVANKKLHVDGGMTIGANYDSTTNPTNGLNVEGAIQQAGNQVLHAGNYTSYSPTLIGGGASGTWGISVTGIAGSAYLVSSPDGDRVAGNKLPTSNPRSVRFDFATAGSVTGAAGNYAGVMTYAPWDGTSASTGDSSYQLAFTNQSGVNASGPPQLLIRNGINSTWNSWHTVITTASTQSAPRATRANGFFYIDDNYGVGVVGNYNASRYQTVYAMGDAYKMAADGASLANMYGIGWSHPNAGGAAGNLTDHGMLIINNGGFRCAISNSIVASGNITAYSDERLKTNWRDMPVNYVARLAQVKVGVYERIDGENGTQVGVSAQSLQELLPQAIMTAKDEIGTLSVSYGNAALASAVELAKDNVDLRARITRLESLIEQLLNKE